MDATTLYDQLAVLVDDVTAAVAALGGEPPCRVLIQPYTAVADDGCCDDPGGVCRGQLAVTLDQLFRARDFPLPDVLVRPPSCECGGDPVAVLRARLSRCVPVPDDAGNAPTPEELSEAAALALLDATALLTAACVFSTRYEDAIVGTVLPFGPEGDCGAYEVTIIVGPDDFTAP